MTIPADRTNNRPRPAAFLDRDGTMIVECDFLGNPDHVEPLPGAIDAIRMLNRWGYYVIGVSNQSGIARGYYDAATVDTVNARVVERFAEDGARIDRIYYCSHHPEFDTDPAAIDCPCRKPRAGMVDWARSEYAIDVPRSLVVGDRAADVGLGMTLGVPGILVLTGYGESTRATLPDDIHPAFIARDLLEAVRWWGENHRLPPA